MSWFLVKQEVDPWRQTHSPHWNGRPANNGVNVDWLTVPPPFVEAPPLSWTWLDFSLSFTLHLLLLYVTFWPLQVCGHELMAHRAVLACCSPYLFEIFNSDLEPHGISHVKFEDLNPEAVEILLNYAYTAQWVLLDITGWKLVSKA